MSAITSEDAVLTEHEESLDKKSLCEGQGQDNVAAEDIRTEIIQNSNPNTSSKQTYFSPDLPVFYSSEDGATVVTRTPHSITRADGTKVIVSPVQDNITTPEKTLQYKDLKLLKTFSIIAIFLFFPTGIPAFCYSLLTAREYHRGIEIQDLTVAKKRAKMCEKLVIISVVAGLMTFVIIFAIVEKSLAEHTDQVRDFRFVRP